MPFKNTSVRGRPTGHPIALDTTGIKQLTPYMVWADAVRTCKKPEEVIALGPAPASSDMEMISNADANMLYREAPNDVEDVAFIEFEFDQLYADNAESTDLVAKHNALVAALDTYTPSRLSRYLTKELKWAKDSLATVRMQIGSKAPSELRSHHVSQDRKISLVAILLGLWADGGVPVEATQDERIEWIAKYVAVPKLAMFSDKPLIEPGQMLVAAAYACRTNSLKDAQYLIALYTDGDQEYRDALIDPARWELIKLIENEQSKL